MSLRTRTNRASGYALQGSTSSTRQHLSQKIASGKKAFL